MAEPSSNSPGLFETMNLVISRFMAEVHTCMPGVVVSYDVASQTAVVQPSLNTMIAGTVMSLPQLHNVPVLFPATATSWLRLPVATGDPVLLHFAEGSLEKWRVSGGQVDPEIPARYTLGDAIATPGLHAQSQAIAPKGAATSVELVNGAMWLELTSAGEFKVSSGQALIDMTSAGKFKITNGTVDLLAVLDSVLTHLIALTTTNAVVGAPCLLAPSVITQLTLDQTNLDLLKA